MCGGQRTTYWSQVSPFWGSNSGHLAWQQHLYLLRHLASPTFNILSGCPTFKQRLCVVLIIHSRTWWFLSLVVSINMAPKAHELNAWFSVSRTVWEGVGGVALLENVSLWDWTAGEGQRWSFKSSHQAQSLFLCFLPVDQEVISQLLSQSLPATKLPSWLWQTYPLKL